MRALAIFALAIGPQGGFVAEQHLDLGLSFSVPRSYESIPTPPTETSIVFFYAEKPAEAAEAKKTVRPDMAIVWIDRAPDPRPPEPASDDEAPSARPASDAKTVAQPIVNSLERFVARRLPGWKLGPAVVGKERDGYRPRECVLVPRDDGASPIGCWVYAWEGERRIIAVLGSCANTELKEQVKLWRYTAERMQIREPEETDLDNLRKRYAATTFPDPELRIGVRRRLGRGWRAEDTAHYIVAYDTPDQPLIRKVCRDLEVVREEFARMFPTASDRGEDAHDGSSAPDVVARVRVCKDRDEYLDYGGAPATAGFWNAEGEELVLYDARKERKQQVADDTDTFVVLYHEAFHQFVHHALGGLAPQPWFDEGHGDYFSGLTLRAGQIQTIGPNPWRVRTIQTAIAKGETIPWKEIVRYEHRLFLKRAELAYAQSWSMIWFLRRSPAVEKHPEWSSILPTYFETLKTAWAEERAKLEAAGKANDRLARWKAGFAARNRAADAAFQGVDFDEIERSWRAFVEKIDVPKGG